MVGDGVDDTRPRTLCFHIAEGVKGGGGGEETHYLRRVWKCCLRCQTFEVESWHFRAQSYRAEGCALPQWFVMHGLSVNEV